MRIEHRSMHPQTRAACKISLYRKTPEIQYKKQTNKKKWRKVDEGGTATKQYINMLTKFWHRKSKKKKTTATLENVVDVFWFEHYIKMT